jgi:hypothetical protein
VEYELSVMTRAHRALPFLFVAGRDGLSLMRINHLLANHPDKYIDQTPCVVSISNCATHGLQKIQNQKACVMCKVANPGKIEIGFCLPDE